MVSANELRIGNWVTCLGYRPFQIEEISSTHVTALFDNRSFNVDDLKPISISIRLLKMMKFERISTRIWAQKNKYGIDKRITFFCINKVYFQRPIEGFAYFHKLQNIFFMMYGKDMKFPNSMSTILYYEILNQKNDPT